MRYASRQKRRLRRSRLEGGFPTLSSSYFLNAALFTDVLRLRLHAYVVGVSPMITSFIWAQIASRDDSASQIPVDGGRYVRSAGSEKGTFSQSLGHAFWFLMISAGIAFFTIIPTLYAELATVEIVRANGINEAGSLFQGRLIDTLVGAFAVGVGIASVIWTFSGSPKDNRDPYDRDERLQ
ncbi:hypothetical protein [Pseudovibrio sp. W74]|uniref:hypothetical protein n=2 Tax=Pseudovibrio TaxID=258255 RepID=UPI001AD8DDE8|nr:hypothetical protein [Pseudovibrio sp. W74]